MKIYEVFTITSYAVHTSLLHLVCNPSSREPEKSNTHVFDFFSL